MLTGGMAPQYGKEGLGPYAGMRWGAIANRLMQSGNAPHQAATAANNMTREAIERRLMGARKLDYTPEVPYGR